MASRIIYKYPLYPGFTYLTLPPGSKILKVALQFNGPQVWIEQDPYGPSVVNATFIVRETGINFDDYDGLQYIDSFQVDEYVGHVYGKIGL